MRASGLTARGCGRVWLSSAPIYFRTCGLLYACGAETPCFASFLYRTMRPTPLRTHVANYAWFGPVLVVDACEHLLPICTHFEGLPGPTRLDQSAMICTITKCAEVATVSYRDQMPDVGSPFSRFGADVAPLTKYRSTRSKMWRAIVHGDASEHRDHAQTLLRVEDARLRRRQADDARGELCFGWDRDGAVEADRYRASVSLRLRLCYLALIPCSDTSLPQAC